MVNVNFLIFQTLCLLASFLVSGMPTARDGPLQPGEDPFYTPPAGYESTAPGTILKHRTPPFPIAAFGLADANIKAAYQILYRTTNTFGEAIATVATIMVPHNADYTKLLSYQVAQDAADPNCSPSFALQQSSDAGEALSLIMPQLEYVFMAASLSKGWVVTVPDHLGRKSAFLANTLSGQATLDGIRASLASTAITGISSKATVTMWGYSGGSLASGFAAELQPSYAPELKIAGAALGGTVPKILPVIEAVNKGIFAGLVPAGIQGLANEFPIAQTIIDQNILPNKTEDFYKTKNLCLTGNILEYIGQDVYSYVKDPNVFTSPLATTLLNANAMGQNIPQIPILIYKSVNDEISPIEDSDELYETYCANGATVEYRRDTLSEHAILEITGAPDAFLWLVDRMNGVKARPGCSKKTELTAIGDPRAILTFGVGFIKILLSFLSFPIGPIAL